MQIIVLVAFPLLFLLLLAPKSKKLGSIRYILAFAITFFAYMGHSESALYIVAALLIIPFLQNGWRLSASMSGALGLIYLIDFSSAARYYTVYPVVNIAGFGTTVLSLLFFFSLIITAFSLIFNYSKRTYALIQFPISRLQKIWSRSSAKLIAILSFLIIVTYLSTFIVWLSVLPTYRTWLTFGFDGSIPWYFYPLILGVVGLISLSSSLYFLFTGKWHVLKMLSPFYLLAILSIVFTPYYLDYRMAKHLYLSLSIITGFSTAILIESITKGAAEMHFLTSVKRVIVKINGPLVAGFLLLIIIILSIPSTIMFVQSETYLGNQGLETYNGGPAIASVLPRRVPLTTEELQALEFIQRNIDPVKDPVLTLPRGSVNQFSEVVDIGGSWIVQSNRFMPLFEVNQAQEFFNLINKIKPKYIYLNWLDKQSLQFDSKYSNSFFKGIMNYLPVAYSNSKVTIYSVPQFSCISSTSEVGVLSDVSDQYLNALAFANINYTIVTLSDYRRLGVHTLIVQNNPVKAVLTELTKWVAEGNRVIVLSLPRTPQPVFQVNNGSISNVIANSSNMIVLNSGNIQVRNQGRVVFDKDEQGQYTLAGEINLQQSTDADNHLGMIFSYQDNNNYYYFFLRENKAILYKMYQGQDSEVWSVAFNRQQGTQQIIIDVNSSIFGFKVNGQNLGSFVESNPIKHGFTGYRWLNIEGQLGSMSTLKMPENREIDGISGNGGSLKFENISATDFQASGLPAGSTVNSYYIKNGQNVSVFSCSIPYASAKITYVDFPSLLQLLLVSKNFKTILEVAGINLPTNQPVTQALVISQPINYLQGSVNLTGVVQVESFSIIFPSDVNVTTNHYLLQDAQKESLLNSITSFNAKSLVLTSDETSNNGYISLIVSLPITLVNQTEKQTANTNSYTLALQNNSDTLTVVAKDPKITVNGNTIFNNAFMSIEIQNRTTTTNGQTITASGQTHFEVTGIDNEVIQISGFVTDANINVQRAVCPWDEWNINTARILVNYPQWTVLLFFVSIVLSLSIYKMAKKSSHTKFI